MKTLKLSSLALFSSVLMAMPTVGFSQGKTGFESLLRCHYDRAEDCLTTQSCNPTVSNTNNLDELDVYLHTADKNWKWSNSVPVLVLERTNARFQPGNTPKSMQQAHAEFENPNWFMEGLDGRVQSPGKITINTRLTYKCPTGVSPSEADCPNVIGDIYEIQFDRITSIVVGSAFGKITFSDDNGEKEVRKTVSITCQHEIPRFDEATLKEWMSFPFPQLKK